MQRSATRHAAGGDATAEPGRTAGGSLLSVPLAFALTAIAIACLGWSALTSFRQIDHMRRWDLRIAELRGTIVHLDEVLTMSAHMAVATGDTLWETRYRAHEPALTQAVAEALSLASDVGAPRDVEETDAANTVLVRLENRAFALVRGGHRREAGAVLESPEYLRQKRTYSAGMDRLDGALKQSVGQAEARELRHLHTGFGVAAAAVPLLLLCWLLAVRGMRRGRQALTRRTEELARLNMDLDLTVADRTRALELEVMERRRAEEHNERLVTQSQNLICTAGFDGRFTRLNPAWERTLGYPREALLAMPFPELAHPDDHVAALTAIRRLRVGEATVSLECRCRCADGSYRTLQWTATPTEDGRAFHAIGQDITARQEMEAEWRRATEAAEQSNRAKSEFLANMSHELRTPLNSVIGFTSVLLRNKTNHLQPQDLAYLGRIHDNGRHLLGLINGILDLSKVESGRLALDCGDVALGALIDETLAELQGQVHGRPVALVAEFPVTLAPLRTDAGKLKQVLINLVGNALKFTERGRVTVRVAADPVTHQAVRIDVEDTGIGIPLDRQAIVFEAFQQADNTTARRYGGTGLGLAITRALLKLMGCRVTLRSEAGTGSTFSIHLGTGAAHAPDQTPVRPPAVVPRHGRVVVVGSSPDLRDLLARQVRDAGGEAVVAEAADALRLAREQGADLVLLALRVPEMLGLELLEPLRPAGGLAGPPTAVVGVLASRQRGNIVAATEMLDGPVGDKELTAALWRQLEGSPAEAEERFAGVLREHLALETAGSPS
jgi:PAS domain S-box-containing protein